MMLGWEMIVPLHPRQRHKGGGNGAWRSLVSAPVWAALGRQTRSPRPFNSATYVLPNGPWGGYEVSLKTLNTLVGSERI